MLEVSESCTLVRSSGALGLVVMGILALGCAKDRTISDLERGTFSISCMADDATCETIGEAAAVPEDVALSATLRVSYTGRISGGVQGELSAVPASPHMVTREGTTLGFALPGTTALLARSTDGVVADFIHVTAIPVAHLELTRPKAVMVGEETTIEATPFGADGQVLGGSLAYQWESTDAAVASFTTAAAGRRVTVRGNAAGVTTLRAGSQGVEAEVILTVTGAP